MRELLTLILVVWAGCSTMPAVADVASGAEGIAMAGPDQPLPPILSRGDMSDMPPVGTLPPLPLIGARLEYITQPGDSMAKISARFGVSAEVLASENGVRRDARLKPGQKLWVDNRHIVPHVDADGVYVNLPQRMLYLFQNGELLGAYPVGVGKPDWQTPTGTFTLVEKAKNKAWLVPPSIQEEMRREGKMVKVSVPAGPDNPLGKHWLRLSMPRIGIHGTIRPTSIYRSQSHGCIRLHPHDMEALFGQVKRGMNGRMIYEPVLFAEAGGRIYLEVNRDVYRKGGVSIEALHQRVNDFKLAERIDWTAVAEVFARAEGLARDITLPGN